jgi:hypothetical protein
MIDVIDAKIEQTMDDMIFIKLNNEKNKIKTAKTKTQLLLEKMDKGEYVSDYEYLSSIPGYMEELNAEANDPNLELIPIEEVIKDWKDRKKRKDWKDWSEDDEL